MCNPMLYTDALKALHKFGKTRQGEKSGSPALMARRASLAAAVDWVIFVLEVAGSDRDVAYPACSVLLHVSRGVPECDRHQLLRAVGPALSAMRAHRAVARIQSACISLLDYLVCCEVAGVCGALRQLGAEADVLAALSQHRGDSKLRNRGSIVLKRLAAWE